MVAPLNVVDQVVDILTEHDLISHHAFRMASLFIKHREDEQKDYDPDDFNDEEKNQIELAGLQNLFETNIQHAIF